MTLYKQHFSRYHHMKTLNFEVKKLYTFILKSANAAGRALTSVRLAQHALPRVLDISRRLLRVYRTLVEKTY